MAFQRSPHASEGDRHLLQLYTSDPFLEGAVERFVAGALGADQGAVLVATPSHWAGVRAGLEARGFDVAALLDRAQLRVLDAEATLRELVNGGVPSRAAFEELVRPVLREARAAARCPRVSVYGEMVNLLWEREAYEAADLLEALWTSAQARDDFTLLCSYRADVMDVNAPERALQHAVRAHHRVNVEPGTLALEPFERAVESVLGPAQVAMLRVVVEAEYPASRSVEEGVELRMVWLRTNMPRVAERILLAARKLAAEGPA